MTGEKTNTPKKKKDVKDGVEKENPSLHRVW